MRDITRKALPLEGGGLGGGVGTGSDDEAQAVALEPRIQPRAHTPNPGPSPLEGEGRRYADGHRYDARAGGQARRMRREPTLGERKLWAELRKLPLHVRRQAPIGAYVADFAVVSAKLIIEVDGASHVGEEAEEHDAIRDAFLHDQGFRVLRLRDADVLADAQGCAARVQAWALKSPRGRNALPLEGGGR